MPAMYWVGMNVDQQAEPSTASSTLTAYLRILSVVGIIELKGCGYLTEVSDSF